VVFPAAIHRVSSPDWIHATRRDTQQAPPSEPGTSLRAGENRQDVLPTIIGWDATLGPVLRLLRVPADNQRGPQYMDQALAAMHQGNPHRQQMTFGFVRHQGEVGLTCCFPEQLHSLVERQLYAQYPDANLTPLPEGTFEPPTDAVTWIAELRLSPELFPCKRYSQFEDALNRQSADPLTAILTALASARDSQLIPAIDIVIQPARKKRIARLHRCITRLAWPFFRSHPRLANLYLTCALSRRRLLRCIGVVLGHLAHPDERPNTAPADMSSSRLHEREDDIQAASEKAGRLLFETKIHLRVSGPQELAVDANRMLQNMAGTFGQFTLPRLSRFCMSRIRCNCKGGKRSFLLSTEELATLWHPATATVQAPTMAVVESREAEPPVNLPTPDRNPTLAILGMAIYRGQEERFGILPDDRRRHMLIEGKTGMGKSTLLHRLVSTDIAAGRGVCLLDPHGDLCDAVLAAIPSHRTNDVVLFDAGDRAFPLAFNILSCPHPEQRPLIASGVVAAFKKVFGEFWGPRLEFLMRNALLALLEIPGTSLLSLLRFLTDEPFRSAIVRRVADPIVRSFWQRDFTSWPPKLQAEALSPVLNKIGAFASSPVLRNIIGQATSTLNLRQVMDEGKVLLVNLSKGRIGDDASSLLGSFLVTAIQLAAMSRADGAEDERRDFYFYVDEFQNYATDSFATILSEARKYRLNLTVANQYLSQMDEATRDAVFGNIGSLCAFQVGTQDAEILAEQLGGSLTAKDLLTLPRYQAYLRLLIDGHPSRPFSLRTLPPPEQHDARRPEIVRRYCRQRYARPAERVEREIHRAFAA
jgi:hypothetical protein